MPFATEVKKQSPSPTDFIIFSWSHNMLYDVGLIDVFCAGG